MTARNNDSAILMRYDAILLHMWAWSVCRQLERINASCTSAVKMSLLLLDYLFDRDTQAMSNVSGSGKLGKHRLDPLLMYGIQCKELMFSWFRSLKLLWFSLHWGYQSTAATCCCCFCCYFSVTYKVKMAIIIIIIIILNYHGLSSLSFSLTWEDLLSYFVVQWISITTFRTSETFWGIMVCW